MEIKIPRVSNKQKSIIINNERHYEESRKLYSNMLIRCFYISAIFFALSTLGGMITFFIQIIDNLLWIGTGCIAITFFVLGRLLKKYSSSKPLNIINAIFSGVLAILLFIGSIILLSNSASGIEPISIETHISYAAGMVLSIPLFTSCIISILWLNCKLDKTWQQQIEHKNKLKEKQNAKEQSQNKKTFH